MEPSFDTWTSVFLFGASFGIFLSMLIFSGQTKRNTMLGFIVLGYALMLSYYVIYWTGYYVNFPGFIAAATGFTYLIGPLFYCFLRSTKTQTYFKWPHLIPFFIIFTYHFLFPLYPRAWVPELIKYQDFIQNSHLLIYTILSFHFATKKMNNQKSQEYQVKCKVTWFFTAYASCFFLYYILYYSGNLILTLDYTISLASTIFIYFIGYVGFKKPNTLFAKDAPKDLYEKSGITPAIAEKICMEFEKYVDENKPFLNGNLRLADVSDALGFSQHHISQALNMYLKKGFNDYINEKRLSHARSIMEDPDNSALRIKEIAFSSGFNNKTTFSNIFKKHLGVTPKTYREDLHLNQKNKSSR